MYFKDSVQVLLRRWYVVVVGMVLTAGAAGAAVVVVPTAYQATGQLLLLQSVDSSGTPSNPYLNLQPGLTVTASLIGSYVSSKDTQTALKEAGYSQQYSIALSGSVGPLLEVSVQDTDPGRAIATRDELLARLEAELERIQSEESVPAEQLIHGRTAIAPKQAEVLPGNRIRAIGVIGAVGMVLTLMAAFILDRFLRSRRSTDLPVGSARKESRSDSPKKRRRRAADSESATSSPPPGSVPTSPPSGQVQAADAGGETRRRRSTRMEPRSTGLVRVGTPSSSRGSLGDGSA